MITLNKLHSFLPALALFGLGQIHAQITYVDAVEGPLGNTGITGQPLSDISWVGEDSTAPNNSQWSKRAGAGNEGTIFQALPAGSPASIPELTTTISGLADGTYNVWVFFQDNVGDTTAPYQNWSISAGLASGSLTTYWGPGQPADHMNNNIPAGATTVGVANAADLNFTSSPVIEEGVDVGLRHLFGAKLGQVTVSGGSVIEVFVDMLVDGASSISRVWYDGVGYELVPPLTAPTFSDWIADYPDVGGDIGVDDDADGDGIDNGVENFFGTDPSTFSQGLVSGAVDSGAGTFTFTHPFNDTPASDLTATYRWSKDLSTFTAGGDPFEGTTVTFAQGTPSGGFVTVTATVTGTPLSKLFVDVQVTQD